MIGYGYRIIILLQLFVRGSRLIMKFLNISVKNLSIFGVILSIGLLSLYALDPFKDIKKAATDVIKIGEKTISSNVMGITAPIAEIAIRLSSETLNELSKLGLPTDPRKLLEFAVSKMSEEQIKELANNIMKIVTAQLSDLSKISTIALQPVNAIVELLPLIPSTDMISDFVLNFAISKYQIHTFAQLKAFHEATDYRYVSEKEKTLIKSREEFESNKGVIGQNINLNEAREVSRQLSDQIKKFINPLQQLIKKLESIGSPLLKPLEALGREFRPTPLACLINLGFIYNLTIFICHLKLIEGLFQDTQFILERNLDDVHLDKSRYTMLVDWEKDPLASTFMKILRTALSPANTPLERLDEMFVDPISELPWALKSVCTWTVFFVKHGSKLATAIAKEIVSQISSALGGGVAGVAGGTGGSVVPVAGTATVGGSSGGATYADIKVLTKILSEIVNESFIVDMISQTFYWSWIRYIEKRFDRIKQLITQARADGVQFDSNRYKEEFKKIIEFKEDYITGNQNKPKSEAVTSSESEPTDSIKPIHEIGTTSQQETSSDSDPFIDEKNDIDQLLS